MKLNQQGIETRPFFVPMHQQPCFRNLGLFKGESYPVSEEISAKGMYLPSGPGLKREDIEQVCAALKNIGGRSW
jgi:perosamine synthetase